MVLNSLRFAAFFLIFLAVLLVLTKKARKYWLCAGNCLFYLSWERWSCVLLVLSVLMIWFLGARSQEQGASGREPGTGSQGPVGRWPKEGNKFPGSKIFLILPILWNVGLLVFFRYTGLIGSVFSRAGIPLSVGSVLAPLGLSFYTLRCISYIADVWRGTIRARKNPLDVFLYVSFFPQIISGPIEKPEKFFRELDSFETKNLWNFEAIWNGFLLFVWGLFLKIVLAERLSAITAHLFGSHQNYGFWELLAASLAYTLQIYCDFCGYSEMSRGISAMIGFSTMRNFCQPYLAPGIKNFWRRWHISLTTWLTDYIYIPLGGSRKGLPRKYLNIIIVFLVSGLWHGNTLNFIFWGLLHAFYQILEDLWDRSGHRLPNWLRRIITLAEVNFAWIFFNAGGLNRGFRIVRQMFTRFAFPGNFDLGLVPGNLVVLGLGLLILLMADVLHEKGFSINQRLAALPLPLRWLIMLVLFWSVIMLGIYGVGYDTSGFIYAQF